MKLHNHLASFETPPVGAPQDEELLWVPPTMLLILRSAAAPAEARLEGRTAAMQS